MKRFTALTAAVAAAATLATATQARAAPTPPSPSTVAAILCVHDSYVYTTTWQPGSSLAYVLFGHQFYRTSTKEYGNGEGSWTGVVGDLYGGGLSFMVGTWNRAHAIDPADIPYASSTSDIAAAPIKTQVLAMALIVQQDGGLYHEWPNTGRACNLPM